MAIIGYVQIEHTYFEWNNEVSHSKQFYLQWSEIMEFDVKDVEEELEKRMENIYANDCCVLVYTVSFHQILLKAIYIDGVIQFILMTSIPYMYMQPVHRQVVRRRARMFLIWFDFFFENNLKLIQFAFNFPCIVWNGWKSKRCNVEPW